MDNLEWNILLKCFLPLVEYLKPYNNTATSSNFPFPCAPPLSPIRIAIHGTNTVYHVQEICEIYYLI